MNSVQNNLLILLTSNHILNGKEGITGFHYEEMTTPYYVFTDAGVQVDIASIEGGNPPHDPDSLKQKEEQRPFSVRRFLNDKIAMEKLLHTLPIKQVNADDYDAIYLAGGHGAMIDFPENPDLAQLVSKIYAQEGIIAAICHGTAGLLSATKEDGSPLVKGLHVNSFTNEEERETAKGAELPFLLETRLREIGGIFESSIPFKSCIVQENNLITGQNPASAQGVSEAILVSLKQKSVRNRESDAA